jgi:hypothetical protein
MTGDGIHDINACKNTYLCACLTVPATGSYVDEVKADNPVLWLRFEDEFPKDYSAADGNHWVGYGSAVSIVEEAGGIGKSAYFNGTAGSDIYGVAARNVPTPPPLVNSSYEVFDNNYAFAPGSITFEMWVKSPPDQPQMQPYGIFFQQIGAWTNEPNGPGLGDSNGTLRVLAGTGWWYTFVPTPLDQKWHQLVVTYDVNDANYGPIPNLFMQLYLDGNLAASFFDPNGWLGNELSHIMLGAENDIGYTYNQYAGYIDEFAIYPGVLSACRVAAHYKAWQPKNCADLQARGLGLPADMDKNCRIDFNDFAIFATDWRKCNDPCDPLCMPNWPPCCPPGIAAPEVISVDFKGNNATTVYGGTTHYYTGIDANVWRTYYPGLGWGVPVGSQRADQNSLAMYNEPCVPSTYAAQVWIGVDANGATYQTYGPCDVNLMDDGFRKTGGATNPGIRLFGKGAFGGTGGQADPNFDIYVYGGGDGNACNVTLTQSTLGGRGRSETNSVTGGFDGNFVQGKNYVIFHDVNIGDGDLGPNTPADGNGPNSVTISFDGAVNGLQLVKLKTPLECVKAALPSKNAENTLAGVDVNGTMWRGTGFDINAVAWDVSYDTNRRDSEITYFGPDIGVIDINLGLSTHDGIYPSVFYIDSAEYMKYDINVGVANKGNYAVYALVDTDNGACTALNVYIDDIPLGTLTCTGTSYHYFRYAPDSGLTSTPAYCNLFAGPHEFKWQSGAQEGYNLYRFVFVYTGDINMPDCNAVYKYGFNYAGDFTHDCHVDFNDLQILTDVWLTCYSPDPNDCLP